MTDQRETNMTARARRVLAATMALLAVALPTACGDDDDGGSGSDDNVRIALLVGSVDNAYQASSLRAAEAEAKRLGAEITPYDAAFDVNKQVAQLEDVVGLGTSRFDGVALIPVDNRALVNATEQAIEAGLAVGVANGPVGDRFDTKDPQVEGVVTYVGVVWEQYGKRLANLVKQACEGVDPCNVALTTGLENWAPETAFKKVFKEQVASDPNIKVVAEPGPTGWSRDGGLKIIGDLIQSRDDLHVIVAADQALIGAEQALEDAGQLGKVKLIGLGGTDQSVEAIKSGDWFATIGQAPADEGRLVVRGIVEYVRNEKKAGGIDSQSLIVNDAEVTEEHVDEFKPQFQG